MRRRVGRLVVCTGLMLLGAGSAHAEQTQSQPPQRFAWWRSEQYQKHLGLSADQVNRLEAIFQKALPDLRKGRDELDRQDAALSRLIEMNADEASIIRQEDKVEAIRSQVNKMRILVLVHHRQVLTPDQRVKLKAMFDQLQADRAQAERDRAARPPDPHKP